MPYKVGDLFAVWWMPTGARLLELTPYTGKFDKDFEFFATFEDRNTKKGSSTMAVSRRMMDDMKIEKS